MLTNPDREKRFILYFFFFFRILRPTDYLATEAIHNPQVLSTILQMLDADNDGMITPMEIEESLQN